MLQGRVRIESPQQQRREVQPPLRFRHPAVNDLATDLLSLAEYDALILRSGVL
jgi:hypothetical protein